MTHGWPALAVAPFLIAALVLAWDRWVRRRRRPDDDPARPGPVLALAAIGVLTHPTLDWMNTYGMRWWLPFDGSWSYGDALFIVDPWIWLALAGAVFLSSTPARGAVVGWAGLAALASALVVMAGGTGVAIVWALGLLSIVAAHRLRPHPALDRRAVRFVCAGTLAYVLLMVGAGRIARGQVRRAAESSGLVVREVMVAPRPAVPFRSDVEVLTPDAAVPGTHTWLPTPVVALRVVGSVRRLAAPPGLSGTKARAIVDAAGADDRVRDYLVWSRYPLVRVTPDGAGWRVRYGDARYDDRAGAGGLAGLDVWVPDSEVR